MRLVYSVGGGDGIGGDSGGAGGDGGGAGSPTEIEVRYDNGAAGGAVAINTMHTNTMHYLHGTPLTRGNELVADAASSWRDARANISGAVFARGGADGADVWVTNKGSDPAIIHMVEVEVARGTAARR